MSRFGPSRTRRPAVVEDDLWVQPQQAAEEVLDDFEDPEEDEEEERFNEADEEVYQGLMGRVEKRLEAANYYRAIISADFFPGDGSQTAAMVQARVQEIARGELMALLGIDKSGAFATSKPQPAEAPWLTDDEKRALKALAQAALARQAQGGPNKPVAAPPAPKAEPVKPAVPRVAPAVAQPIARPKVPVAAPAAPPPAPAPEQKRPTSRFAKPERPARTQTPPREPKLVDGVPTDFVDRIPGAVVGRNGRITRTLKNEDTGAILIQDLSPPPINPARKPMPQGEHFTMVTAQQAAETVMAQPTKAKETAGIALARG